MSYKLGVDPGLIPVLEVIIKQLCLGWVDTELWLNHPEFFSCNWIHDVRRKEEGLSHELSLIQVTFLERCGMQCLGLGKEDDACSNMSRNKIGSKAFCQL